MVAIKEERVSAVFLSTPWLSFVGGCCRQPLAPLSFVFRRPFALRLLYDELLPTCMQLAACAIPELYKCSAIHGLRVQSVDPCFAQDNPWIAQIHALRTIFTLV